MFFLVFFVFVFWFFGFCFLVLEHDFEILKEFVVFLHIDLLEKLCSQIH